MAQDTHLAYFVKCPALESRGSGTQESEMRTATIQIRKDDASVLREAGAAFGRLGDRGVGDRSLHLFLASAAVLGVVAQALELD